jgi:spore coat polysaccharide biosynthesis protein SpsF (cytidylyltransferase family)
MLEIPFLDEIVKEKTRETARRDIVTVLEARFGEVPRDVVEGVESVVDEKQLHRLVRATGDCPDLAAFRQAIPPS